MFNGNKDLALVNCGKNKLSVRSLAKDLYTGELFQKTRRYAEKRHTQWMVLSALLGLVHPDEEIDPYDLTLIGQTNDFNHSWASLVAESIVARYATDIRIFMYAGREYRKHLQPLLEQRGYEVHIPLQGKGIGQQLAWLKTQLTVAHPNMECVLYDCECCHGTGTIALYRGNPPISEEITCPREKRSRRSDEAGYHDHAAGGGLSL